MLTLLHKRTMVSKESISYIAVVVLFSQSCLSVKKLKQTSDCFND